MSFVYKSSRLDQLMEGHGGGCKCESQALVKILQSLQHPSRTSYLRMLLTYPSCAFYSMFRARMLLLVRLESYISMKNV